MALGSTRSRVCLVIVGAVLTVGPIGASSSGAAAASPVVNVSPRTGLVDLQQVTESGRGFSANVQVGTVECRPGALAEADCDLSTLVYGHTDTHGSFALVRYVRRLIGVGKTKVDCGAAKGCILGAGNIANLKQASGRTIFFNPKIPPKVAKISVTPSTKLVDHQFVTVSGSGYAPLTSAFLAECLTHPPAGAGTVCDYSTERSVSTDARGAFAATNVVLERRMVFFTEKGSKAVDCGAAAGTCRLQATASGLGSSIPATAPLAFDPTAPLVTAFATVSPSSALVDLEPVTVSGTGFTPGYAVTVQECVTGSASTPTCDYTTAHSVTAGFRGQFALTYFVRRDLANAVTPTGVTTADCAAESGLCELTIQGTPAQTPAAVALTFDPMVPAVISTVSASPSSGLVDNQSITVSLDGFTPNQPVVLEECGAEGLSEATNLGYCDYTTAQTTGPFGPLTARADFVVRAAISGQGGLIDCTVRPGACVLVAVGTGNNYYGGGGLATPQVSPADLSGVPNFAFTELSFASP